MTNATDSNLQAALRSLAARATALAESEVVSRSFNCDSMQDIKILFDALTELDCAYSSFLFHIVEDEEIGRIFPSKSLADKPPTAEYILSFFDSYLDEDSRDYNNYIGGVF